MPHNSPLPSRATACCWKWGRRASWLCPVLMRRAAPADLA